MYLLSKSVHIILIKILSEKCEYLKLLSVILFAPPLALLQLYTGGRPAVRSPLIIPLSWRRAGWLGIRRDEKSLSFFGANYYLK